MEFKFRIRIYNGPTNMGLDEFAKTLDSCQPALSAQADKGRDLSLFLNFLHVKGPFYYMIQPVV